jgi:octaprenyl-diphosphate synthase
MSTLPAASSTGSPNLNFASVFVRLQPHLAALDRFLRDQIQAFEPEIREMADYCIDTSGKRIRPALVFLSGDRSDAAVAGPSPVVSTELVRVAAVVELVHLATLVHDDIMDEAELRRSRKTAARAYGPEAAVLLGDALFAHALHLAAQFPTTDVCLAVSDSTRKVCAGEIIQTLRRRTNDVSRADYYRVIDLKTAELFRISCQLGSKLAGYPEAFVQAAAEFGRRLGVAYQIYDDLADFFGQEAKIGKTLGTDLFSGKLTLPLLLLSERLDDVERDGLMEEVQGRRAPDLPLRLQQMRQADVFEAVVSLIEEELRWGESALAEYRKLPPVRLLQELADVLRTQLRNLGVG